MKPLITTDLGQALWEPYNWYIRGYTQNILSVWVAVLASLGHTLGVITPLTGDITLLTGALTP